MHPLRRPADRLADCVWLARFVDKTRLHLAGSLHPDYVFPYAHPIATDGAFFQHFGLAKDEIIAAIRQSNGDDAAVAAWFLRQPGCTDARIQAWNEVGPHLGRPGQPVHRGYQFMLKTYFGGQIPDPRVNSVFTAIAYDEGFLDEVLPRGSATSSGSGADADSANLPGDQVPPRQPTLPSS